MGYTLYDYYGSSPSDNPQGPSSGVQRVLRGGSFNDFNLRCRLTTRHYSNPDSHNMFYGFRVAF